SANIPAIFQRDGLRGGRGAVGRVGGGGARTGAPWRGVREGRAAMIGCRGNVALRNSGAHDSRNRPVSRDFVPRHTACSAAGPGGTTNEPQHTIGTHHRTTETHQRTTAARRPTSARRGGALAGARTGARRAGGSREGDG